MEKRKPGRPSKNLSRRNEILEKAAACFAIKGYDDTTLDEIGDSLGFNKAALYYYFENKEDLFGHVMDYERNRLWELAKLETNSETGIENKLIKYFAVRTEIALIQIKLNELSKSNLIDLNSANQKAMVNFREKELTYLLNIFTKENSKQAESETREFITLLINVLTSITMSTLLMKDLKNNVVQLPEITAKKVKVLKYLLNSFLH